LTLTLTLTLAVLDQDFANCDVTNKDFRTSHLFRHCEIVKCWTENREPSTLGLWSPQ